MPGFPWICFLIFSYEKNCILRFRCLAQVSTGLTISVSRDDFPPNLSTLLNSLYFNPPARRTLRPTIGPWCSCRRGSCRCRGSLPGQYRGGAHSPWRLTPATGCPESFLHRNLSAQADISRYLLYYYTDNASAYIYLIFITIWILWHKWSQPISAQCLDRSQPIRGLH